MSDLWMWPYAFAGLYTEVMTGAGVTGSDVVLESSRVEPGHLRCVHWLSVEDETTSYTEFRVRVAGHGDNILLMEQESPANDKLFFASDPIWLAEGETLGVVLTGTTNADVLKVYLRWNDYALPETQ